MPRATPTSLAQRSRDEGLARLRRLTWYSGIGAAVLTAIASAVAAVTIPGHSQAATSSSSSAAPPSALSPDQGGGTLPDDQQPVGNQPPGPAAGGSVVVSGGS